VKQQAVAKAAGKSSATPTVDRVRALRRFTRENAPEVLALLGGAALWEVLGWSLGLQWLPPFSKVMEALAQFVGSGVILANLGSSLQGLIVGFSLALILGLFLGSLMGRYRPVEKALDIYVHAFFVCPSIVFAPVFFANLVFTHSFRDTTSADMAFASNLIGAMVGGTLEYIALITGFRVLLIVVAGLYAVAFVLAHRWRLLADVERDD